MLKRINLVENEIYRDVPNEYWREIFEAYNYFFFNYKRSPLLVINVVKVDFSNPKYLKNLIEEISTHKNGVKYYAPA
jgi:deoxyadenosine/deoxycytidine kinase